MFLVYDVYGFYRRPLFDFDGEVEFREAFKERFCNYFICSLQILITEKNEMNYVGT